MTSRIDSYSEAQALPDPFTSPGASAAATLPAVSSAASAAGGGAASSTEAVTLTPEAQTSTDLLEAARAASGVDHQAVQSLKADISSGAYQVPPESLATTIVAALAELRS